MLIAECFPPLDFYEAFEANRLFYVSIGMPLWMREKKKRPAGTARRTLNESEPLAEADRIHTDVLLSAH